ncbi:TPA: restriction endonuclease subunit S [Streptococcus suis]|nr:restriction endonuclease subunit S [Streptococcus suis]NQM15105.1 restriction endonuclease subunit S [Streptococcus suis]HEM2777958.1 restriction endonuclease subunit S [Streptococcus suis]HEM2827875.1 restriction endonuclease subunit S [Streptococcus suis]HEM3427490.1 restriction endonuclease subunit S [Streptococcus suis]
MNKKKEIVPKLRFPEFIGDKLKITKLEKISSVVKEKAGENKYTLMSVTSGVGLIPQTEKFGREIAGDSYKNYIVIRKYDFAYNKSATKQFPEGYISMLGEYDIAAVPNSIFTCFRITANESYPLFFDYLWHNNYHGHWLRKYIEVGARAHGALSVDTKHLWSMPLTLPDFKEQQKIADCLSSIDDLIDAESRKLRALEKYKKGLMQKLFPAEGKNLPEWRFPEFQGCGEWKSKSMGKACKMFSGGTPDTSKKEFYGGTIPFIRSAEINKSSTELFITEEGFKNSSAKMVKKGDILIALYGANSGEVALSKIDGAINQAILCLRHETNNAFVYHYFTHMKNRIISKYIQGGQGNLSGQIIKSVNLYFPKTEEQQKIADCLSEIDKIITEQSNKVEQLKAHKKGLMQGLFPSLEEADV